ncbi:hypothetical protein [Streptomyces sp. MB09-02B]|uniref:hypothetical protein n=1 Tax=Streptomyces sp. MB09-02B TaxID=3028667 RepID=UPI0029AE4665|nr:hypothetical protein [Streptomyces sp. MB09-02B]MDX3641743.1 hypothetical protein [Streptomyces sp. MB09-02B]
MPRFGRADRQRHSTSPEPRQGAGPGLTPIEVHVPVEGQVTVGGLPVVAGPGESVQDAVLNYLHRLVLATGHTVSAMVHDERIGFSTPLRVVADGSSHFAGEPVRFAAPRQTADLRAPAAPTEPAPAPPPAATVAPTPEVAPTPAESVAPSLLAEPVMRINEAVQRGRIESAAAMAEQSIAAATKTLGEEHPEVLQLRELAAYIAYLAGDAHRSFSLSMSLARIHRERGDVRAYINVQSAAAAWRAVRDPAQGLALGHELIGLWSELAEGGGPAAAEMQQLEAARARMGRLTERARAGGPSAERSHAHDHRP